MKKILYRGFILFSLISITNDTAIPQNTLFKKYPGNPLIDIGVSQSLWRTVHAANATVLTADETSDGTWRIYLRGNGSVPLTGGRIGILIQDSTGFSPYGPWLEYANNPVLGYGPLGSYDNGHLLDCSPVVGEEGKVYMYYKGIGNDWGHSLAVATSTDGGYTFEKYEGNPLKRHSGGSDAIYLNGQYYIYYTNVLDLGLTAIFLKISSDPINIRQIDSTLVLIPGGGPGNFDSESIGAGRIFYLEGKWYMIYPGSNSHFDFPGRFHAAYSSDLINWAKVNNSFPLMTRGSWGEWDQGAIWYGEVFQYGDTLYMLYEGWGCNCMPLDRNEPYFSGNSQTGIARVSVDDFLLWAGGGYDSSWVANEISPDGTIVDFETYTPVFHPTNSMTYEVIDNPVPDAINSSLHVGKVITTSDTWELLWSAPFVTRFDFSKEHTFKMKVYSEHQGNVYFKIEHPHNYQFGQLEVQKQLNVTGQWVEMEFDFSPFQPRSDLYGKIVLLFDAGSVALGEVWYFDDIKFEPMATFVQTDPEECSPTDTQSIRVTYDHLGQKIQLKGAGDTDWYVIYSISGVAIQEGRGNVIDVGGLESGAYIVRIKETSVKFIKN